jgi:hypothetical protein
VNTSTSTRPKRCWHCGEAHPSAAHVHLYQVQRDGRNVTVFTYGGRRPLGGDPNPGVGAVRREKRVWSKGSARTAGPTLASGYITRTTAAADLPPPGCSAGHSATRLARCGQCGAVYCDHASHGAHVCGRLAPDGAVLAERYAELAAWALRRAAP